MLLEKNQTDRKRQTWSGKELPCHQPVCPAVVSCVNNKLMSTGKPLLVLSVPCNAIKHTTTSCSEGLNRMIGKPCSEPLSSRNPVHLSQATTRFDYHGGIFLEKMVAVTITESPSRKQWSVWNYEIPTRKKTSRNHSMSLFFFFKKHQVFKNNSLFYMFCEFYVSLFLTVFNNYSKTTRMQQIFNK